MAIPESQLETWSHQGSVQQSRDTYAAVKRTLEAPDTKYANAQYEVFLQGSYGNDTNIYAESDVDTVIRLDSTYHFDTSALNPQELQMFHAEFIPATYSYADYKSHVVAALKKSFGQTDVTVGDKAVKVKANGNRRDADVVVATEFRRYYSGTYGPEFVPGICLFTRNGSRIVNYPKQHSASCTAKHQATYQWFKPMVRILKNMRSRLVDHGMIAQGGAPSYFLEGLLYNVPNDKFGKSYEDTFVASMNWILNTDHKQFVCPNGQFYLVHDTAQTCWSSADYDRFIAALKEQWNTWGQ